MWMLLLACSGDDGLFGGAGSSDDTALFVNTPAAEPIWTPDGASWDLAEHQSRVVSTTQHGGSIWAYDPATGEEEEVGADLGEPLAVASDGDTLFITITDSGQHGLVATLDSKRNYTVLAEMGDQGQPMRRPEDMALSPQGHLVVADPGENLVWHVETDGSGAWPIATGVETTCVGFHEGQLYVGTEQAVFELDESSGELNQVDDQPAYGLFSHQGRLLAGGSGGVREVGAQALAGGIGRAAAIIELDGSLYITDQSSGEVYIAEEL